MPQKCGQFDLAHKFYINKNPQYNTYCINQFEVDTKKLGFFLDRELLSIVIIIPTNVRLYFAVVTLLFH